MLFLRVLALRNTDSEKRAETPVRAAVLATKVIGPHFGIQIPEEAVHEAFGVSLRSQRRILACKQPRRLHNQPDASFGPRGCKCTLWRKDIAVIGRYVDDPTVPLDDKG